MTTNNYGKVAVIMGGNSAERDVSLMSGGGVLAAQHDVEVEFDRHALAGQVEPRQQVGDGQAVGQVEGFAIELNVHGYPLANSGKGGILAPLTGDHQGAGRTLQKPRGRARQAASARHSQPSMKHSPPSGVTMPSFRLLRVSR